MEPTLAIVGLWLVFGGTHVGLATRGVRDRLAAVQEVVAEMARGFLMARARPGMRV